MSKARGAPSPLTRRALFRPFSRVHSRWSIRPGGISRSWLKGPSATAPHSPAGPPAELGGEIRRWYGREAHPDFEVCADDHCQRYQGITKAVSPAVAAAVRATRGEMLLSAGAIGDARFSKCCGGFTERYATAWDDREIRYLVAIDDGTGVHGPIDPEAWIRSSPAARSPRTARGASGRIWSASSSAPATCPTRLPSARPAGR